MVAEDSELARKQMSMSRTLLKAGGSLNVSWHLGYSHRGGYRIELVSKAQVGAGPPCAEPGHHSGDHTGHHSGHHTGHHSGHHCDLSVQGLAIQVLPLASSGQEWQTEEARYRQNHLVTLPQVREISLEKCALLG